MRKWMMALLIIVACYGMADAQGCAVCTKTASTIDEESARGLNGGIVYLAFLPLALIGTIGFVWWKRSKHEI
jgi:hypothetical protein